MSNLIPESKEMMVLILSQLILAISAYFFFDSMHQAPAVAQAHSMVDSMRGKMLIWVWRWRWIALEKCHGKACVI